MRDRWAKTIAVATVAAVAGGASTAYLARRKAPSTPPAASAPALRGAAPRPSASAPGPEVQPLVQAPALDPLPEPAIGLDGVKASLSDLPMQVSKRTIHWVHEFGATDSGRRTFRELLKRGSKYREYIEAELLEANLPSDLVWVAGAASSFRPSAVSPSGAAGLFQIPEDVAEAHGLVMTQEFDERRSIPKATETAMAELRSLREHFGAWDLALAAYDAGDDAVDQAIKSARQKLQKGPRATIGYRDLADLALLSPRTLDYVPRIHALAIVFHNRDALHLDDAEMPPAMHFAELSVPGGVRIDAVAKLAGMTTGAFREYNPGILGDRVPSGYGDLYVSVPAEKLADAVASVGTLRAAPE